jgi:DNA polymerase V
MFAVIDCNNFFVSCEKVFNPALEGRAVVVLSNNDGCVVSRSQEAKDMGVKMGMPAFQMEEQFGNRVQPFSSNYKLYGDMSRRVMAILQELVPSMEIYSIDECFASFKGMDIRQIEEKAQEIVYKVRRFTGIPVCVGVASTKTLAKVANWYAKKYKGYHGYCIIDTDDKRQKALQLLEIGEVWGIGRRYSKFLKGEGVNTALDFTKKSAWWVKKNMGIVGLRTQMELGGQPVAQLDVREEKKSITTSRSFGEMVSSLEELQSAVSSFASACAGKLRQQGSAAGCITVYILTNFFREDLPRYYNSITIKLPEASDSTFVLVEEALKGLKQIYRKGYLYKKAGVIVGEIVPCNAVQQNLFEHKDNVRLKSLNNVLDSVNARYGRDVLKIAVQGGLAEEGADKWVMKRTWLSGNYTTDIKDIIEIKA